MICIGPFDTITQKYDVSGSHKYLCTDVIVAVVQVLLFPAMKPEEQRAGAVTSAAPPEAVQHPGPSSAMVSHLILVVNGASRA